MIVTISTQRLSGLLMAIIGMIVISGCESGKTADKYYDMSVEGSYSARFSDDASHLINGSIFHGASLWRLRPMDRLFNWNHADTGYSSITAAAFSMDGRYAATADTRTIAMWDRRTGEPIWYWNAPADIKDMALTNSGRYALLGLDDYTATLFDIQKGGIKRRFPHDGIVYDVSFSRDNTLLATASDDLTAGVWNLTSGRRLKTLKHSNQVLTAEISPSGRYLVTSAYQQPLHLWSVKSGRLLRRFGRTKGHYGAVRFSSDETQLLTGNTAGQVQLWRIKNGKLLQTWRASSRKKWVRQAVHIEDVAFSGRRYLAAGANGRVYWFSK